MKTTMRYHPTPVRMAVYHQNEKKKQASVRRWRKGNPSLRKTLMLGKAEGRRRRGQQRTRRLDGITNPRDMNLSKLQETVKDREAWSAAVHRTAEPDMTATEQP